LIDKNMAVEHVLIAQVVSNRVTTIEFLDARFGLDPPILTVVPGDTLAFNLCDDGRPLELIRLQSAPAP